MPARRMVTLAAIAGALLFVAPVPVFLFLRFARQRALSAIALDIPLAMALDLMGILLLSRLLRLDAATIAMRGIWGVLLVDHVVGRLREKPPASSAFRSAWPRALDKGPLLAAGLAALGALFLSRVVSTECHAYDRSWHIPLVGSLRGQKLPFDNVYEPGIDLAYHLSGDAAAAALQTLSGGVIHSSLALSLAHNCFFSLSAASIALLMWWLGLKRAGPAALASLAPLLMGPMTLLVEGARRDTGYNFVHLYKLSFRPHVVLAILLMVGIVGSVLVRLRDDRARLVDTAAPLVACVALLAITDEGSVGVLGLAIGSSWLIVPQVLAARRLHGAGILAALLAALVGASLLFHGTFAAGVGVSMSIVPLRVPGYYRAPLPWSDERSFGLLLGDLLPLGTLIIAGVAMALWRRRREHIGSLLFAGFTFVIGVVMLMKIDIGERSTESHRFVTAAMVCVPMAALSWLIAPRPPRASLLGPTVIGLALSVAAMCTLDWMWVVSELKRRSKQCAQSSDFGSHRDFYEADCRKLAGSRIGQRPILAYFDRHIAYLVTGCRPTFTSGPEAPLTRSDRLDISEPGLVLRWTARIGEIRHGTRALDDLLDNRLGPSESLRIICHPRSRDLLCRFARKARLRCTTLGEDISICYLPPKQRERARSWVRRYEAKKG